MDVYFRMKGKSDKEPAIYISQGDEGKQVSLLLKRGDGPLPWRHVYRLEGTKPSGKPVVVQCEEVDVYALRMNVTKELSDEAGTVRAQVVVYGEDEGQRIGSETILVMVEPLGGVTG